MDNVAAFKADIQHGNWDSVLATVSTLKLPREKLIDLHEHVVLELIEMREIDTAKALMRHNNSPMQLLKQVFEL